MVVRPIPSEASYEVSEMLKKAVRLLEKAEKLEMVEHDGKKVPAFAADGKGAKDKTKKGTMAEKDKYCMKNFGKKYSECSAKEKAQCDRVHGKVKKEDATTAFLRERGIIVKYEQETTVENGVPQLLEQPSGTRATVYSTNHRLPAMNDGPSKSIVSEVAKMPYAAQTGYSGPSSPAPEGTSLHMHLNYAGGVTDNLDSAEDALASLRKAYPGSLGIIEEIASLTEEVFARL